MISHKETVKIQGEKTVWFLPFTRFGFNVSLISFDYLNEFDIQSLLVSADIEIFQGFGLFFFFFK